MLSEHLQRRVVRFRISGLMSRASPERILNILSRPQALCRANATRASDLRMLTQINMGRFQWAVGGHVRQRALRHIVGPSSPSWIFGHMLQLILPRQYGDHEFRWQKKFGSVYRIKGCFGQDRLMVADPLALQFLLNSPMFERGGVGDMMLHLAFPEKSVIAVKGMFSFRWWPYHHLKLSVDLGDEHRRIRAALNVGFSAATVRTYRPVFERAAETISEQLENYPAASINICPLLSVATLQAISEAVLRYSLQDLGDGFVDNNIQIVRLSATQSPTQILVDALSVRLPLWLLRGAMYLPTPAFKIIRKGKYLAHQIGRRIVRERLDTALQGIEMNDDLFSRLVDPNISDGMSEDEVASQVGFLLLAGQETTANTIAYGLLELARHPDFQEKLRAEIHSTQGASASGGSAPYDSMPLLNAFIKAGHGIETIRLYPAGPFSERVAVQNTTIPLSEAITTSTGERISHIPILKGQLVMLGIASYQRLESSWGTDAHEFNPSRWLDGTAYRGEAVGPYANLLSFLGGPRTCLGWRFAILEMQVILCHLVAKYSFAEVEGEVIRPCFLNNLLPIVSSGEKALPLRITRI
ncbi:Cytochrome P450 [Mycena venus]|uniref:Cytochrome P450 n=1 Tax=Mycena venus TaxID=2733690 RepID=A0A8H6Y159_9AGAR|nr:Cytochrome P450 [Mycena venus]